MTNNAELNAANADARFPATLEAQGGAEKLFCSALIKLLINKSDSYGVSAQEVYEAFVLRFGVDAHQENFAHSERHIAQRKQLRRYAEQTLPAPREHMSEAHMLLYAAADAR